MMKHATITLMIFAVFLASVSLSFGASYTGGSAQSMLDQYEQARRANQNLSLNVEPEFPEPNSTAKITAVSFSIDVNRSLLEWRVNNKAYKQGIGAKEIEIEVGAPGSQTIISFTATSPEGDVIERQITLKPAQVDIVWEAQTQTPPGYKGKSLLSSGANIKISAVPFIVDSRGRRVPSSELFFNWKLDYKNVPQYSGRGRDFFTTKGPALFYSKTIEVEVTNFDKSLLAYGYTKVFAEEAKIILYPNHPSEGVKYNRVIKDNMEAQEDETRIVAIPYFFAKENIDQLSFSWLMNGKVVEKVGPANEMVLRREPGRSGTAQIRMESKNPYEVTQMIVNNFTIKF